MSADKVTSIKRDGEFTTVEFRNIERAPMHPETAMHSQHALFSAIKLLLGSGVPRPEEVRIAQSLALIGEHLADQLTDRL